MAKKKATGGCPYCHGSGDCYGQCDERFKAQVAMIVAPMRKLQKDLEKILSRRKPRPSREA